MKWNKVFVILTLFFIELPLHAQEAEPSLAKQELMTIYKKENFSSVCGKGKPFLLCHGNSEKICANLYDKILKGCANNLSDKRPEESDEQFNARKIQLPEIIEKDQIGKSKELLNMCMHNRLSGMVLFSKMNAWANRPTILDGRQMKIDILACENTHFSDVSVYLREFHEKMANEVKEKLGISEKKP